MDSRVDCSEYFFVQLVPRRVLIVPHEMSVKNVAVSADCPIVNFYTAAATRQLGLRPVRLMVTAIYHALLYRLSILSRLSRMQNEPRDCLTPTRLPARICASLRSFKCGDSAARPAACSQDFLAVKKIPTPLGVGIFLTGSYLSSQAASSQVLSTYKGLTTVFGMETGGSP